MAPLLPFSILTFLGFELIQSYQCYVCLVTRSCMPYNRHCLKRKGGGFGGSVAGICPSFLNVNTEKVWSIEIVGVTPGRSVLGKGTEGFLTTVF